MPDAEIQISSKENPGPNLVIPDSLSEILAVAKKYLSADPKDANRFSRVDVYIPGLWITFNVNNLDENPYRLLPRCR